ncbi:MAG: phenylacetate--CoA ligase [Firmicutes bacterium]|jgi:phenylacetate-CoA ligase|nr:phenylacetate--CoA ligase [Bacillota bacterium]
MKNQQRKSRKELRRIQLDGLKETVKRVYENVPFYKNCFDRLGITPEDISSLEDLEKLPFTTKEDLRDNYPFGLLAVPMKDIVRLHASSGTTGKATVVAYTKKDIGTWAGLMERVLRYCGVTESDIIQNAYGYGLFTGGLGFHYGAEKLGATVVPISGGNTKRQINLMQDLGSTVLTCTPSYALHLAEVAGEMKVDLKKLPLKVGIFGAEPWSEKMREEIEEKLSIKAFDIYGLSEVMGPGVACECSAQEGLHIFEDHFIPEIIDPKTGKTLPPGSEGELVLTTITKEGLPLIRYRTRDITSLIEEECSCGAVHVRMKKIMGRSDDMLIIRGVNVFPSQIESVLMTIDELNPHYLLVINKKGTLDELEVWVETAHKSGDLSARISREIYAVLGINVKINLVPPKTLKRSEGKAVRVLNKNEAAL